MREKTQKGWQKSNLELAIYLGDMPCEIDEDLYYFMLDAVMCHYNSDTFQQCLECQFERDGIDFYHTIKSIQIGTSERYFYLGILPEFKQ